MSELDDFLEWARGGPAESSGAFTIDAEGALAKLSGHQLAERGMWLVKMVQAAVAGGAPSIQIDLSSHDIEVRFLASDRLKADHILDMMTTGQLPSSRWQRHLLVALRAAYGQNPNLMAWSAPGGGSIRLAGKQFERGDQSDPNLYSFLVRAPLRWLRGADEYELLCRRCWLCPVPLLVNGQRTNTTFPPHLPIKGDNIYLATAALVSGGDSFEADLSPPQGERVAPQLFVHKTPGLRECFLFRGPEQPGRQSVRGLATLGTDLGAKAELVYVQDGALLDPIPLPLRLSRLNLRVYLSGNQHKTDLSEMKLLDVSLPTVWAELRPQLLQLARQTLEYLPALRIQYRPTRSWLPWLLAFGLIAGNAWELMGAVTPLAAAGLGVLSSKGLRYTEPDHRLGERLQHLIDQLERPE
ncbi:MAG: hypothetical protein AB7S38_12155 [Vulcanimicrobiota bacterium]